MLDQERDGENTDHDSKHGERSPHLVREERLESREEMVEHVPQASPAGTAFEGPS